MIALDEDALICDFAEFYHIYNIYEYPPIYIATLAIGLRDNSRIKLKLLGLRVDLEMLLLAHIVDNTAMNIWAKTKDAKNNINRPQSFVELLSKKKESKEKAREFNSGEDFEKERRRLIGNRTG